MSDFNITSAKLTGRPGESGWAQVHEFAPESKEKLKSRGRLFAVVATAKEAAGVESVVAGRELITRLHEEYFGEIDKTPFNALKDAVEKVIREFASVWGKVEIAAASLIDDVVYTAAGGGGQAVLFRQGKLAKILSSQNLEVISASGHPQKGDILILATSQVFKVLAEGVVKGALENPNLTEAVESLAPAVHARPETGNFGLVFVKFDQEKAFLLDQKRMEGEKKEPLIKTKPSLLRFSGLTTSLGRFIKSRLPERKIYVKTEEKDEALPQNKRTALSIGIILLILLVISIGFGLRQRQIKETRSRYEESLSLAKHEFEEAKKLFSLNPERARELYLSARQRIEKMKADEVKDDELERLIQEMSEKEGEILGEYRAEMKGFVNLSILTDNFEGDEMMMSGENVFVFDPDSRKVVQTNIKTKKTAVLAGPDTVGKANKIAAYQDRVFILEEDGIYELAKEKKRVIEKDWEGEVLIRAYAGNLYLLDKKTSQIWRYPGIEAGFGLRQKWLAPGAEPDLSQVFSMVIDGSIWFLSQSGKVFKFTRGNQEEFALSGATPPILAPTAFYTDENLASVYVLEKDKARIVVFDKKGQFVAQYFSEELKKAKDLVVSEKEGKILVLTAEGLSSIKLRHL